VEDAQPVSRLPLPREVTIPTSAAEMMPTPREMRELKQTSGLRLEYLFGEESDLDEKTQMMIWLQLRRQGFEVTWDEAADVQPVQEVEQPDPTSGASSKTSPPSVATGE
jgi:hypothetical protein